MIGVCQLSQSASEKQNQEKKAHIPLRTSWILKQMCQPCLVIIQSCYFDYRINKPFAYSRRVICVSCSLDRDVRRSQRIIGFYYPQISEAETPSRWLSMAFCSVLLLLALSSPTVLFSYWAFLSICLQEQSISSRGGLAWWKEFLIVPCYNFHSSIDEVNGFL